MELAKKVIGAELELFEKHFKDAVKSRVSLLDRIMQYIVKRKGKQMRPMFVLLSAKLHGEINDSSYRAASLVQLLLNHLKQRMRLRRNLMRVNLLFSH